jgi:hypothetical protein
MGAGARARVLAAGPLVRYGIAMSANTDLCAAAARNNALWCDAMARAHGAAGRLVEAAWINPRPAPRFHPNLVTLGGPAEHAAHRQAIRHLKDMPPAPGWAAKDSFATLDLAPLGFHRLFEASWIHRAPGAAGAGAIDDIAAGCSVRRAADAAALEAWERAWRAGAAEPPARLSRATLLAEPDHAIIAVTRDDAIVAGCVASRSDGVLGISNLFAPETDDGGLRASCLAAALRLAPGSPLVGYEGGADLARMKALGFAAIGALRVWQSAS